MSHPGLGEVCCVVDVVARHLFRKANSRIGDVCSGGLNHPLPSKCSIRRVAELRTTRTFGGTSLAVETGARWQRPRTGRHGRGLSGTDFPG